MRDLIVPSFEAAIRADKRFVETRKRLPNYAEIVNDPSHQDDGFRQMVLHKLDQDVTELLQQSLILNKALGDPRIAADVDDPQVMAERRALQQLYDAQQTRANLLNEFVIREHVASAKDNIGDNSAFGSHNANQSGGVSPPPDWLALCEPNAELSPMLSFADATCSRITNSFSRFARVCCAS